MLICHKHLVKHGFNISHGGHIIFSELYQNSLYLIGKIRTRQQSFIHRNPIVLCTTVKDNTNFTRFTGMIYPMMRKEPSFTLLICLWMWLFSMSLLDHIFHKTSVILVILFILDKPFLEILWSQFSILLLLGNMDLRVVEAACNMHLDLRVVEAACNGFLLYCIFFPLSQGTVYLLQIFLWYSQLLLKCHCH